jgi:hypothetical protein
MNNKIFFFYKKFLPKKLEVKKKLGLHSTKAYISPGNFRNTVRDGHATLLRRVLVHTFHAGSKTGSGSGPGFETEK